MRKIGAIVLLLLTSILCRAQMPTGGNAFFGYSYARGHGFTPLGPRSIGMNGWDGSAEAQFLSWLGVVGDFDWHYGGVDTTCAGAGCTPQKFRLNSSRHTLLFGPRVSWTSGKYTPFAQVMFGLSHQTDSGGGRSVSDQAFANSFGAGLDYKLLNTVGWRVQMDWIHNRVFATSSTNFRLSTGVVFTF